MPTPARVDASTLPAARWENPQRGTRRLRTAISGPARVTDGRACGVGVLAAADRIALRFHPQPGAGFGLTRKRGVAGDGMPHRLARGVALYIDEGAVHAVPLPSGPLKRVCRFTGDRFFDIDHPFLHET